jgi:beta-lactamase superfamily II metal-dependent hydrolase
MPHAKVIQAYRRIGSSLWRTDTDGAVVVTISEAGLIEVTAARSGRSEYLDARGSQAH